MAFVFGNTLICDDKEAATKVTFDKNVLTRSITVSGDVYDPSGTLSGGSAPKGGGVLVEVQKIKAVEDKLAAARRSLAEVEGQLAAAKETIDRYRRVKRDLDVKSHEVGLLEEQVQGSNAARVRVDIPLSLFPSR